ncbi:MAG: TerC family protein [Candidatus Riflebacteria bacterium]|nr:TerC family protein [Candidatus Riflebacteria bacterium]
MTDVGLGFWIGFHAFVVAVLALDLGIVQKKAHAVGKREAACWVGVWVGCALVFAAGVGWFLGSEKCFEYLTGYVIEQALSVDNLFVFLVIFASFGVPPKLQRRVLLWGILGAVLMRASFIVAGAALIRRFHWLMYVLGFFLVVTAVRLALRKEEDEEIDPGRHPVVRVVRRILPVSSHFDGEHFFTHRSGKWLATPLLVVLAVVETTDVVFALDSIPAIFAITTDPFIVYTSNIFAILGLRAMYFLLAGAMSQFRFMKEGLSVVLGFVGVKMLVADFVHVPVVLSLGIVATTLVVAVVASVLFPAPVARPETSGQPAVVPVDD